MVRELMMLVTTTDVHPIKRYCFAMAKWCYNASEMGLCALVDVDSDKYCRVCGAAMNKGGDNE